MFDLSQTELLEKIDKTIATYGDAQINKLDRNDELILRVLISIREAIKQQKPYTFENIERKVINDLSISRPDWIDELKTDTSKIETLITQLLEKEENKTNHDYTSLLTSTGKVEVTNPVSLRRPQWYKSTSYSAELSSISTTLSKLLNKPIEALSLKKPAWFNQVNYTRPLDSIRSLLLKIANPTEPREVVVKNDVNIGKKVEVFIKDSKGRIVDLDAQFGRIAFSGGGSGGGGGSSADTSNLSTEATLQNVLAKLQEVANNTDELELKADTINLNTDTLETGQSSIITQLQQSNLSLADVLDKQDLARNVLNVISSNTAKDGFLSGNGANGVVSLDDADTAYSVPDDGNIPANNYSIIVYNGSDTDIFIGFEEIEENGFLLAPKEKTSFDLAGGEAVYAYCDVAGKEITYTLKEV